MTDPSSLTLTLAIHARNARLRAWAQSGVPVVGGWEEDPVASVLRFNVRCTACDRFDWAYPHGYTLESTEELTVREFVRRKRCPHLAPLLQPDPPHVLALTELEMLSTG